MCVFGGGWGYQLLYIQGERLGGAVLPWPRRAGGGGQVQGVFCRCVLVSTLKIGRFWQGGRLLLEKDALSFLHPRVVLHQLRV